MYVCLCVRPSVLTFPFDHSFLSDLSQIWNLGRTSDKEGQVRWLVTPEVVNAYTRKFSNLLLVGLAHFRLVFRIALTFFSSTLIKFGTYYVDSVCQEQLLSVTKFNFRF